MKTQNRQKKYEASDHTFVICAYGESPYLEECAASVMAQEVLGNVCIATSTPNDSIMCVAEKYKIPVHVNPRKQGIASDWNFAMDCAKTPLVTLAHQDDTYGKAYAKRVIQYLNDCGYPLLAFTDYSEIRDGNTVDHSRLLAVKHLMLMPLRLRFFWKSRLIRRRILAFGNAICCPAVTLVKDAVPAPLFKNNMKSNIDWQAWEEISRFRGGFVYVPESLMGHRIHEQSTTSELLEVNGRQQEDMYMFRKFWPGWLAGVIDRFYRSNEKWQK